jgi:hypothetical protein
MEDWQRWDLDTRSGEHELGIDFLDWAPVFETPTHASAGIAVVLDPDESVAEACESNNFNAIGPLLPDFHASELTPNPDGAGVRLSYILNNTTTPRLDADGVPVGIAWASGTVPLGTWVRLTAHPVLGPNELTVPAADLVGLGPPPAGATGLVAILDPDDLWVEREEGDNLAALAADTATPSLTHFYVVYGDGRRYDLRDAARLNLPWEIVGIQAEFSKPVYASTDNLRLTDPRSGITISDGDASGGGNSSDISFWVSSLWITGFTGSGTNLLSWTLAGITLDQVRADFVAGDGIGIRDRLGIAAALADVSYDFSVVFGDVTADGRVNLSDLAAEKRTINGIAAGTAVYDPFYDVNGDGQVDNTDYTLIKSRAGSALT